jgi:hypothetical protein
MFYPSLVSSEGAATHNPEMISNVTNGWKSWQNSLLEIVLADNYPSTQYDDGRLQGLGLL